MYPGHWGVHTPDKPAVIHAGTGEITTHAELNARSNRLAQLLYARGLRRNDHIAIFMENNPKFFEVVWAALRSGLYLTTVNRYLTAEEAGYIVNDCGAKALIASNKLADVAKDIPGYAQDCGILLMSEGAVEGFEAFEDAIAEHSPENLSAEPAGQFMLYSSGTTGRPKGILRPPHEHQISAPPEGTGGLQQALWGFNEDSVYLSPAPLYHSAPLQFASATLGLGGAVVMMPRFDETAALQAIDQYGVTHSQWVPTMFTRMLKLPAEQREGYDLSSHKVVIHAAAPCPAEVKRKMMDWWGPILYEYYAGTEANGFTHAGPEEWLANPGTVGKALMGVIHICDDAGNELPAGEAGLVYFENPERTFEYHNAPDKTAETYHAQHPTWSALGDVGYVNDDGYLFLTDRATFMIISGGVNIYPQEIEDALVMHDKVADVAVIGVPDPEMGEAVKAVVQPAEGVNVGSELEAELLAYARESIAHYKCPKSVDFEAELPRLPTGKLYKRLLKDRYWGKTDSRIV
ncbi:MAG: acyl-CoA synthetase [Pseudomonadota bacterium]